MNAAIRGGFQSEVFEDADGIELGSGLDDTRDDKVTKHPVIHCIGEAELVVQACESVVEQTRVGVVHRDTRHDRNGWGIDLEFCLSGSLSAFPDASFRGLDHQFEFQISVRGTDMFNDAAHPARLRRDLHRGRTRPGFHTAYVFTHETRVQTRLLVPHPSCYSRMNKPFSEPKQAKPPKSGQLRL